MPTPGTDTTWRQECKTKHHPGCHLIIDLLAKCIQLPHALHHALLRVLLRCFLVKAEKLVTTSVLVLEESAVSALEGQGLEAAVVGAVFVKLGLLLLLEVAVARGVV